MFLTPLALSVAVPVIVLSTLYVPVSTELKSQMLEPDYQIKMS